MACTLLSEQMHRAAFDATFDLWFPAGTGARTGATDLPTDDDGSPDVEQIRQMVADMLADGDAENDGRLADLVSAIVDRIGRYESTRGEAFSTYQAMSTIRRRRSSRASPRRWPRGPVTTTGGRRPATDARRPLVSTASASSSRGDPTAHGRAVRP